MRCPHRQQAARANQHPARRRVDPGNIERLRLPADFQASPLPDRKVDDALVRPQHRAGFGMDNLSRRDPFGADRLNHFRVVAIGHEADVLAVRLGGHDQPFGLGDLAHVSLGHAAQRKAQVIQLCFGRCVKEIALVAGRIERAVQFRPGGADHAADVVSGGQAIGPQFARHAEQVGKFRPHIAADAGDRRAARQVIVGKAFDHFLAEAAGVIEHIVGDPQPVRHGPCIANVIAGTARALAPRSCPVIVQLQCNANDFRPAACRQRGHDRAVDPARHRHDDPLARQRLGQLEQAGIIYRWQRFGTHRRALHRGWGVRQIVRQAEHMVNVNFT